MLNSEKYPHPLSQTNAAQWNDNDEGGLNLGQVGASLRRRALLIAGVTGVVATAAVLKAETDPPLYQGKFEILTKPVTGESQVTANLPQSLNSRQQQGVAPPESVKEVQTTIKVLQSPGVLAPVVEKLQPKYPDLTYNLIAQSLTITSKEQNILEIEYISSDEKEVRDVLNSVKDEYLKYSLADRQADVKQAIKFVREQMNRGGVRKRVEIWQDKLRNLQRANNLVAPEQKAQEISNHIATLTQQRLDNRVQLEQMVTKYKDLQKEFAQQSGELASNSILSENVRYQKILDELQKVDVAIKTQSAVWSDESPNMVTLGYQKENLVRLLAQEGDRVLKDFDSRIRELQARDRALVDKINALNNYLKTLASVNRDYVNIQRELKIATDTLNQFSAKEQALEIEKAQKVQPWNVLDPKLAQVNEPEAFSASTKKNLALGTMLGLLLGVGAALVVDKLSNVFYSSKELKDATRLPLLGVVPLKKELGTLTTQDLHHTGYTSSFEVFRSLYTNILLLGSDAPIRSLVISSAAQGDGKSTVAIQLAQAAAAMGQKVLLVDANLRCPCLHHRLGLMNIQGLTDVISSDLDWNNVIERSPLEDNLYLMTAGPIPPDSIRLLASQKMHDLMNELQSNFDLVIYDTPPLVGFADGYLLASNTNGVVLVAGLGKLKRSMLQQALEEIQVSGTPVLGLVANRSKDFASGSNSYYEQYYKQSMSAERVGEERENEVAYSSPFSSSLKKIRRR